MIELHSRTSEGRKKHFVAVQAIATISDMSTSSKWHGDYTAIKLFDGSKLYVEEKIEHVHKLMQEAARKSV